MTPPQKQIVRMRKEPSHCRHGFTLIELLVVIAIISLLVSILIPSLTKAKELARRTACAANLHNIAIGCAVYANEQNGRLPLPKSNWCPGAYDIQLIDESAALLLNQILGQDALTGAPGTLQDFSADVAARSVWQCPSQKLPLNGSGGVTFYYTDEFGPYFFLYSYMIQSGLRLCAGGPVYYGNLSPTTMDDPNGPLLADALCTPWGNPNQLGSGNHKSDDGSYDGNAGINQAWSDGHVEWDSMSQFPDDVPIDGWRYTIGTNGPPRYCWLEE